jgi:hypothetical protein
VANTELVIERYELKYRLPPALAADVRRAILPYCRPDSASARGPYMISSLYLDTPQHDFYWQTRDEVARRFKLRIRRYSTGPYFVECKRRIKDVISKIRVAVPAEAFPDVILAPGGVRFARTDRDRRNLEEFIRRMRTWGAEPACVVRYAREAFVSEIDDYGRVTFDWELCGRAATTWQMPMHEPGWLPVDSGLRFGMPFSGVILELKCTTAVPLWMSDIVRRFGLIRTGFSKFCTTMESTVPGVKDPGGMRVPAHWLMRRPA